MFNKKFLNKLLTIALISICSSVVSASVNTENTTSNVLINDSSSTLNKPVENFVVERVSNFNIMDNNINMNNSNIVSNNKSMDEVDLKNNNLKKSINNGSDNETNTNNTSGNSSNNSKENSGKNSPESNNFTISSNGNEIEKISLYSSMKYKFGNDSKHEKGDNKRIKYEPDKMWFDYQALFDKRKSIMLEKDNGSEDTEKIEHTDFIENNLARDAVFGTTDNYPYNYDKSFLEEILNCNAYAYCFVLGNCFEQLQKLRNSNEVNDDEIKQLELNYRYFLVLVISASNRYNEARMNEYKKLSNGDVPESLKYNKIDIDKMNLLEIISPLFDKRNNVLVRN